MRHTRTTSDEGGYVLPLTALLIVVLLAFAGLSVDVGGWYARAAQLQRSADAAALAGVVWMPDFSRAEAAAVAAAGRNGFTDGADNISVDVTPVAGDDRRLRVQIADATADQFFSQLVRDEVSVTRAATAEYVLPVPLGSPRNIFGTGNLIFGGSAENYWAAVSGYCSGVENGDLRLARGDRTWNGSDWTCPGLADSPDYDASGYQYAISLAQDLPQALTVEIYDAAYYQSSSAPDRSLRSGSVITTRFEIWDDNGTPLDSSDNVRLSSTVVASGASGWRETWRSLPSISVPRAGRYFLRVFTQAGEANSYGSNGFGIRARTGSTFAACTTISGATGYSASCPQVHGVAEMSIYANQPGTQADFYLAQVDPVHAGKTLRVELFDPGEGASAIQVLNPNGTVEPFTWSTPCNPPTPPTGGCSGTSGAGDRLVVSGTGTQPSPNLSSNSRYNNRRVTLLVDIPADAVTRYAGKAWWKIRYQTTASAVTDRTTWGATIIGDPVHLVE